MTRTLATLVAMLMVTLATAGDEHDQALIERIKPVGELCKAGTDCLAAPVVADSGAAAGGGSRSGADIAAKHCAMCHGDPGIPGAPRTAEEWKTRVDAKGLDGLVATAVSGINAMPPKGMCMDCSDDEIRSAIEALIE
jgi:cytochrome c5